jgi:hypothetical protein
MSDQRERMKKDFANVGDLLGRAFFGDEPLKDILTGEKSTSITRTKKASVTVEEGAGPRETGPCIVCGALEEDSIEKRMITRASGEKIPCPGCLGRK